jgi:hypothetical protein
MVDIYHASNFDFTIKTDRGPVVQISDPRAGTDVDPLFAPINKVPNFRFAHFNSMNVSTSFFITIFFCPWHFAQLTLLLPFLALITLVI